MGMSTTEKVEMTAVLYLSLCCKPNINDLIYTALITNHYPTKCYHYENAVLTMLASEKVELTAVLYLTFCCKLTIKVYY